ncbi:MAG: hypothetical protein D8M52_10795 [Chlorobi bacterium]|nr:hypothetical protein [Chlorobiota bacterium]
MPWIGRSSFITAGVLRADIAAAAMSGSSILVGMTAARPILGKDPFEGEGDEDTESVPGAPSSAR